MTISAKIDALLPIIEHNLDITPDEHLETIVAAENHLPDLGRQALLELDEYGIEPQTLRELASTILGIRLQGWPESDIEQNLLPLALHSIMGATIALGGGLMPKSAPRNDPDCEYLVETGIVQVCLDVASQAPTSALLPIAKRLIGLTTLNLAATGIINLPYWNDPQATLDDLAAMSAVRLEAMPGFYHGMLTSDDLWNSFTNTIILVDHHDWCMRSAMAAILSYDPEIGTSRSKPHSRPQILN